MGSAVGGMGTNVRSVSVGGMGSAAAGGVEYYG